jgi:hypothetical protein
LAMIAYKQRTRPYSEALMRAMELMQAGHSAEEACAHFLELPDADLCYLLDSEGAQVGRNLYPVLGLSAVAPMNEFAPLANVSGAKWSRRPYFRRAVATLGQLQVTRPYPTMRGHKMCMTLSVCFIVNGAKRVVCGDMLWQADVVRPSFGVTTTDANL